MVLVLTGTGQTREVDMTELQRTDVIDGELLEDCEVGMSGCTNTGMELVEDPYEADVHNTKGVLIYACLACLQSLSDEI